MLGFKGAQGDRFFREGGIDGLCRESRAAYGIGADDCRLLEKGATLFTELNQQTEEVPRQQQAGRDDHMATAVREERNPWASNYRLVGAAHLPGLRDLPCVFMQPKSLTAMMPFLNVQEAAKQAW